MVTVMHTGYKASVQLLTYPQRQLRYSATNWANNAMALPNTVMFVKFMGPQLHNATVKMSAILMMTGYKVPVQLLTPPTV